MAERITRKQLKHDEFVEAAFDFEQWLETNWRPVAAGVGVLLAIVLAGYGWSAWSRRADARTAEKLGEALKSVEPSAATPAPSTANWSAALPALEDVAKSGSAAGRTAELYRGIALVNAERATEGIPILESVAAGSDPVLRDLARAKLAWAYGASGQPERSAEIWKQLAADDRSVMPPDVALYSAADALAAAGKTEEAKATLQDLMTRFPQGTAVGDARTLLTALGGSAPQPSGAVPVSINN